MKLSPPTDLDELLAAIRAYDGQDPADMDVELWDGAPTHLGGLDWSESAGVRRQGSRQHGRHLELGR